LCAHASSDYLLVGPIPVFLLSCQLKSGQVVNLVFHWIAKWKSDF